MSILPKAGDAAPIKQSGARWKIVNMKADVIQIPVRPPQGPDGNKRVKASNYVTLGSSLDRGMVGRPQPEVEIAGEEWDFAKEHPIIAEWLKTYHLTATKVA